MLNIYDFDSIVCIEIKIILVILIYLMQNFKSSNTYYAWKLYFLE
jgi:hypothetical protein